MRVHQHLAIGDGDVNFDQLFKALKSNGFIDNPNSIICSSVFAENERASEVAVYQLNKIKELVASVK